MPLVALTLAIFAVSTSALLIQWAKPASALTVASSRVILAFVVLAIIAGPKLRVLLSLDRKHWAAIVGSGVLLAAHYAVWISSLYYTSTAASVALVATQPAFAALIGWFALGERAKTREMIGIAVAALGCAVLAGSDLRSATHADALLGDLLAIAGAVTAAGYLVVGRGVRKTIPLFPYLAAVNGVAGALLLAGALATGVAFAGLPQNSYIAIVLCALVPSVIGHSLINYCVRRVPVHLVSLGILGEPIGASILVFLFVSEVPPLSAVIAGPIILGGIAFGFIGRPAKPVD